MTTGGALVMLIGAFIAAATWFGGYFSHRQVVAHKRRLALEAAEVERAGR